MARPCGFIACRHHMLVSRFDAKGHPRAIPAAGGPGALLDTWSPDALARSLAALPQTCSLDVAARGAHTLDEVGTLLGLTKERARQIEATALRKLHTEAVRRGVRP